MATFVFENMTQAQADAFTTADILAIATTTANARNVGVTFTAATITAADLTSLTIGTKTLTFGNAAISAASILGNVVFNDTSQLELGTVGGDTLNGLAAKAGTVYGWSGSDSWDGTANNNEDFVFGMGGADTIVGGSTASHLYGFNAAGGTDGADVITGGGAGDYVQGNSGNDSLDGGAGSDRILGGAGNDSAAGSAGNDSINGNTGDDTLDGGADNDLVRGGQGNDAAGGGAGNDQVFGDLGTDTVSGGAGIDSHTGGAGNDNFSFILGDVTTGTTVSSVTYYDTILDYTDGEDEIRINTSTDSSGSTIGDAASDTEIVRGAAGATFTTVSAATVYAQQLLDGNSGTTTDVAIVVVGADTYLFYDSDGGATIDSIVKIQGFTNTALLTSADFG